MNKERLGIINLILTVGAIPAILIYEIITYDGYIDAIIIVCFALSSILFEMKTYALFCLVRVRQFLPKKPMSVYYREDWLNIMKDPMWSMQILLPIKGVLHDSGAERQKRKANVVTYAMHGFLLISILLEFL